MNSTRKARGTARRAAAVFAVGSLVIGLLAGCGDDGEIKDPKLVEGADEGGSMRIGISFDQPGLGLEDDGSYSGFDVDTAIYVAGALGVAEDDITWVEADPADREQLLIDGDVDMVLSTYSITAEREELIDFAGPYLEAHQDLLVRLNDTDIDGPKTLNGKKLCSVPGTTSAAYVTERYKGDIDLLELPTFSECVAALADGDVDAVTTDDVILAGYAASDEYKHDFKVVGRGFTDEFYGVGLPPDSPELVKQVDEALQAYIDDGSWKAALEKTVGPSGYDLPDPPTPGER